MGSVVQLAVDVVQVLFIVEEVTVLHMVKCKCCAPTFNQDQQLCTVIAADVYLF